MTFDGSLLGLMEDEITIEPFTSETAARVPSYGAAVTYKALLERGVRRIIGQNGREAISNVQATIPDRVAVDVRSRVTLPAGFAPQQPQILGIEPLKGLGLDHTRVYL